MHESTLQKLSCYDEIKELLLRGGLFQFVFNALPSYPSLIIKFLSSFTFCSINYDNENSYFSMRFKLGEKDRLMTHQEFDTLFGFGQEGYVQPKLNWVVTLFGKKLWPLKLYISPPNILSLLISNPKLFGIFIISSPAPSM